MSAKLTASGAMHLIENGPERTGTHMLVRVIDGVAYIGTERKATGDGLFLTLDVSDMRALGAFLTKHAAMAQP